MNMLSVVLPVEAAAKPNPLLPPLYDIVWSLIILAVIAFIMIKFVLPKFNAITDERSRKIQEGLDLTEKAKLDSKQAQENAEALLQEAREEAAKIRDDSHEEAKVIIRNAQEEARVEAKRIADNSARQIEAERKAAQNQLHKEVGELATALAEKIVGESLKDTGIAERVIDRFLADLEANTVNANGGK